MSYRLRDSRFRLTDSAAKRGYAGKCAAAISRIASSVLGPFEATLQRSKNGARPRVNLNPSPIVIATGYIVENGKAIRWAGHQMGESDGRINRGSVPN
jgi:hypothetical protein